MAQRCGSCLRRMNPVLASRSPGFFGFGLRGIAIASILNIGLGSEHLACPHCGTLLSGNVSPIRKIFLIGVGLMVGTFVLAFPILLIIGLTVGHHEKPVGPSMRDIENQKVIDQRWKEHEDRESIMPEGKWVMDGVNGDRVYENGQRFDRFGKRIN